MKIVAIVQARMGSSRLPGKVMMNLKGKTVLAHVLERVKAIPSVSEVVVATTTGTQDEAICEEALRWDCAFFRGSEEDVLERYYLAATAAKADIIVRITSDCPLLDPEVSEQVIQHYHNSGTDYSSNTIVRSFPRGLDIEVFSYSALKQAYEMAMTPAQREHVTPFIYQNPELFTINPYSLETDFSKHRWTLDTPEDWVLIQALYEGLYRSSSLFLWQEVLELFEHKPELFEINSHIEQKKVTP